MNKSHMLLPSDILPEFGGNRAYILARTARAACQPLQKSLPEVRQVHTGAASALVPANRQLCFQAQMTKLPASLPPSLPSNHHPPTWVATMHMEQAPGHHQLSPLYLTHAPLISAPAHCASKTQHWGLLSAHLNSHGPCRPTQVCL